MKKVEEVIKVIHEQDDKGIWGYSVFINGNQKMIFQAHDALMNTIKGNKELSKAMEVHLMKKVIENFLHLKKDGEN